MDQVFTANVAPNPNTLLNTTKLLKTTPVVLLDDITAELDARALDILLATLSTLPCQVFITSLTDDILPLIDKYWSNPTMFHMKQGHLIALPQ